MVSQLLFSDQQLADLLALSRSTVWRMVRRGDLPQPIKIGSAARFRADEVEAALDRLTEAQRGRS